MNLSECGKDARRSNAAIDALPGLSLQTAGCLGRANRADSRGRPGFAAAQMTPTSSRMMTSVRGTPRRPENGWAWCEFLLMLPLPFETANRRFCSNQGAASASGSASPR